MLLDTCFPKCYMLVDSDLIIFCALLVGVLYAEMKLMASVSPLATNIKSIDRN